MNKNMYALVTGATKGMGRAISFALVKEGYKLIACARKVEELKKLQADIQAEVAGAEVVVRACDFSSPSELNELVGWLETSAFDIDVLVNNVGLFKPGSIFKETDDALAKHMQVNVFTPYHLSVFAGKKMREKQRGHIFSISSVASRNAIPTAGSYSITKFALAGLTAVLREDLKKDGVKVTEIIPGSTLTSSWEGTTISKDEFVLPEDIANALIAVLKMSVGANVDEIMIKPIKGQI